MAQTRLEDIKMERFKGPICMSINSVGGQKPHETEFAQSIASTSGENFVLLQSKDSWKEYFVSGSAATCSLFGNTVFAAVDVLQSQFFIDVNQYNAALWGEMYYREELDPHIWRGIFSPIYNFKTLFSERRTFKTSDLPRWQPKIIIDRRTLEMADE